MTTHKYETFSVSLKKNILSSNRRLKERPNSYNWQRYPSSECYERDENLRFGIWRSAVAPSDYADKKWQYVFTTTVPRVHKSHSDILENLLPISFLGRTNVFVPSRVWTTCTNFDTCCQRYIATCGKKI